MRYVVECSLKKEVRTIVKIVIVFLKDLSGNWATRLKNIQNLRETAYLSEVWLYSMVVNYQTKARSGNGKKSTQAVCSVLMTKARILIVLRINA